MKLKLFDNLTLKIVAFVLSILLWFLVVGEKRSEVRLTVPLELRNLPKQLEITEQSTTQVEVAVRGFSSVIKQLSPTEIDVHLDLSAVVEGPNVFSLAPDEIRVPLGVNAIQVNPAQVELFVDITSEKVVAIRPVTRGNPPEGYDVGKISSDPKTVTITGARRLLNTITQIETEPVSVDEIAQELVKKVKLKLPAGVRVNEESKMATVTVAVIPRMLELVVFDEIPLRVEGETRSYTLSPPTITAFLSGPEIELKRLTSSDIPVFLDTHGLVEGQSTVQPIFKLPEAITVKRYFPKSITITIAK